MAAIAAPSLPFTPSIVESVIWVAERKDVLSTFFGMLALITYVCYARRTDFKPDTWFSVFGILAVVGFLLFTWLIWFHWHYAGDGYASLWIGMLLFSIMALGCAATVYSVLSNT